MGVDRDRVYGKLSNGSEPINGQAGNDSMFAMYCGATIQRQQPRAAMAAAAAAPFANNHQGCKAGDLDPRTAPKRQEKRGTGVPQVQPEAWGVITGRTGVERDPGMGGFKGRGDGECRPHFDDDTPFARGSTYEKPNLRKPRGRYQGSGDVCGKIGQEAAFDPAVYRENLEESARLRRKKSDLQRDGQIHDGKFVQDNKCIGHVAALGALVSTSLASCETKSTGETGELESQVERERLYSRPQKGRHNRR
eukprot:1179456-Prorocentrum_minimum.AAC.2